MLIHNAMGSECANFMEVDPKVLDRNFRVNAIALLYLVPAMAEVGEGAIVAIGDTSALGEKRNFAGFAPTNAAQRTLAESIARELD